MSYEQRKANRQRREKRYKILIAVIITILVIIILSSLFNKKIKVILPVEDTFSKQKELQAVVIKDEKVFKLNNQNNIDIDDKEGKRIPVGTDISNSTIVKDLNLLNEEVEEVNRVIITLEKSDKDKILREDKNKLINNYKEKTIELQEEIHLYNYNNVYKLKKDITLMVKDLNEVFPKNELLDKNIDSLNYRKDKLKNEIDGKETINSSVDSGIFSYKVDGYENQFKPKSFDTYTFDKLEIPEVEVDKLGKIKGQKELTEFKIINNLEWYLALKVENRKDIKEYNLGDDISISYPDESKEIDLEGKVISINNSSYKSVIIIRLNKHLHKFYNSRFPKVNLIQERFKVFKIPSNVIIDKKDKNGVYIKNFNGIVKFKAIKAVASEEDYTYIDKGSNGLISIGNEDEKVSTVSIFDEILLEPHRFKEGQILE